MAGPSHRQAEDASMAALKNGQCNSVGGDLSPLAMQYMLRSLEQIDNARGAAAAVGNCSNISSDGRHAASVIAQRAERPSGRVL